MNTIRTHTGQGAKPTVEAGEGGFVLAAAAFGLMVVIVLVTGGFFMARQEARVGVANVQAYDAFYSAERALAELSGANWDPSTYSALTLMQPRTLYDTVDDAAIEIDITRFSQRLYYLEATATMINRGEFSGASRKVGMMYKLFSADLLPPAALTTRGPTEIRGSAEVHGSDTNPSQWGALCADYGNDDKPGILSDDTTQVSGGNNHTLTGNPAVEQDTTINDSTFLKFGDVEWAQLVAMADKTIGSGGTTVISESAPVLNGDGTCNESAIYNWGDPTSASNPCSDYFPLVYINGSARIQSGGVGQGVLLVDGTLDLRGNFVWHGVVIVQGTFETQGSGNRVLGGVMASNADFDAQSLVGGSVVTNSTCAASRAILENSALTRVIPVANRSWVDISAIGG